MGCVCVSGNKIWKMVIIHSKVYCLGKNLRNSIFFWSCHRVTHQILVTQEWRGFAEKTWTERRIKKRPGLALKYFQLYLTPRKHKNRKSSLWKKLIYNNGCRLWWGMMIGDGTFLTLCLQSLNCHHCQPPYLPKKSYISGGFIWRGAAKAPPFQVIMWVMGTAVRCDLRLHWGHNKIELSSSSVITDIMIQLNGQVGVNLIWCNFAICILCKSCMGKLKITKNNHRHCGISAMPFYFNVKSF